MKYMFYKILTLVFTILIFQENSIAQKNFDEDLELAQEYYLQEEYEKALETLYPYSKKEEMILNIHAIYASLLFKIPDYKNAEKYFKKAIKFYPVEPIYTIDYGYWFQVQKKSKEAKDIWTKWIKVHEKNELVLRQSALAFSQRSEISYVIACYELLYKRAPQQYRIELADSYYKDGKDDAMVALYLEELIQDRAFLEDVQSVFSERLSVESFEALEVSIVKTAQQHPGKIICNELLVWYYLQQKSFNKAYIQARAVDKKGGYQGYKIFEIGDFALNNKAYKDAVRIFQYLVDNYKKSPIYGRARQSLVVAKEEDVKNTFPVQKESILSLIEDYQSIINDIGWGPQTLEAATNMALLYAFYLEETDKAIEMLDKIIATKGLPPKFRSEAKLALGDIYLLTGDPWEASLLYNQVVKAEKENVIGHTAKLKSAKIWFYKGDFELSKSQLDVLKLATSREIANDAMSLSLLIDENLNLDTSDLALKTYADIDLLLYQRKYDEALMNFDQMLKDFPNHTLVDEILWKKAQIYQTTGQLDDAIIMLERILTEFKFDLWADDANFTLGLIYEQEIGDYEKAMQYYKTQMTDFKGSIYIAEARKRFRKLREIHSQ